MVVYVCSSVCSGVCSHYVTCIYICQAEDVVLVLVCDQSMKTMNVTVTSGTCLFDASSKVLKWNVGNIASGITPQMSGTFCSSTSQALGPRVGDAVGMITSMQLHWKVWYQVLYVHHVSICIYTSICMYLYVVM